MPPFEKLCMVGFQINDAFRDGVIPPELKSSVWDCASSHGDEPKMTHPHSCLLSYGLTAPWVKGSESSSLCNHPEQNSLVIGADTATPAAILSVPGSPALLLLSPRLQLEWMHHVSEGVP